MHQPVGGRLRDVELLLELLAGDQHGKLRAHVRPGGGGRAAACGLAPAARSPLAPRQGYLLQAAEDGHPPDALAVIFSSPQDEIEAELKAARDELASWQETPDEEQTPDEEDTEPAEEPAERPPPLEMPTGGLLVLGGLPALGLPGEQEEEPREEAGGKPAS